FIKGEKCDFFVTKTNFLGFIISENGVSMDPKKVAAVREWPTPKNVKDVQSFLGFTNFYRRFIENYAKKCLKLFNLTRKDAKFVTEPTALRHSKRRSFSIMVPKPIKRVCRMKWMDYTEYYI